MIPMPVYIITTILSFKLKSIFHFRWPLRTLQIWLKWTHHHCLHGEPSACARWYSQLMLSIVGNYQNPHFMLQSEYADIMCFVVNECETVFSLSQGFYIHFPTQTSLWTNEVVLSNMYPQCSETYGASVMFSADIRLTKTDFFRHVIIKTLHKSLSSRFLLTLFVKVPITMMPENHHNSCKGMIATILLGMECYPVMVSAQISKLYWPFYDLLNR